MTPHLPQLAARIEAVRHADRPARLAQDLIWGRPIFRPPFLGTPAAIEFNPFPVRIQSFAQPKASLRG